MTHPYSQTWRQYNAGQLMLADFGNTHKNHVGFKKVAVEITASFLLFILFAYSLSLIDQKITQQQKSEQNFEFIWSDQMKENNDLQEYFGKGYIGLGSMVRSS